MCVFLLYVKECTEIYTSCHTPALHYALPSVRAKILAAFCALFGITAFLGWSAVVAIDNTGSLVVETYDKPLMSINHARAALTRSEEHTSELQLLMRTSYAVFCLKKHRTTLTIVTVL